METKPHFLSYPAHFFLGEMFQTVSSRENKIHFISRIFVSENRAVYEIMCNNTVQPGRPQVTI